jgi:predicted GNAT family N-acyltransferase
MLVDLKALEVTGQNQYEDALLVRKEVFVEEQEVPIELEVDEFEENSFHFVVYDQEEPIAAGRLRPLEKEMAKVERICVKKSYRGSGIGKLIMEKIEETAKHKGISTLKLNAQTHAEKFYELLGYETYSDIFMDAGIPHVSMKKLI